MRLGKHFVAAIVLCAVLQTPAFAQDALAGRIDALANEWAHLKYEVPAAAQPREAEKAIALANAAVAEFPGSADPLVWDAIITSTAGGIKGGLGALGMVKDAKAMLEKAEKINPNALNDGSVYTTLGSLYYQVPGFPIAFGDKGKARSYLQRAIAQNPNGIDPNYFYGDFLYKEHDYAGAAKALQKALAAPARPNREIADRGRHAEVEKLLADAQAHIKKS